MLDSRTPLVYGINNLRAILYGSIIVSVPAILNKSADIFFAIFHSIHPAKSTNTVLDSRTPLVHGINNLRAILYGSIIVSVPAVLNET